MEEQKEKAGILQDDNGNYSSMRMMSIVSLIMCIVVAGIILFKPDIDASTGLYIFTAFLIGAFCPKMIQKFAEVKIK